MGFVRPRRCAPSAASTAFSIASDNCLSGGASRIEYGLAVSMTLHLVVFAALMAGCTGRASPTGDDAASSLRAEPTSVPPAPLAASADWTIGPQAAQAASCKAGEVAAPDAAGLAFLREVGGSLEVKLTEPAVKITPKLLNQKAPATAKLKSVKLDSYVFEGEDMRPLTAVELDRVVFRGSMIELSGLGKPVRHTATGCVFTVRDVLQAVEETERQTRGASEWFEGIDVHHVFFEGLRPGDGGVWEIGWGS